MELVCNIDRRGRWFRLAVGIVCLLAAIGFLAFAWRQHSVVMSVVGLGFFLAGAVCVWQGVVGYCIARGMGIRTPI